MSDYIFNEWQTENSQRDYPLQGNSEVPKHMILDAVFFIEAPILLKKIGVSPLGNFLEIHLSTPIGPIIFRNHFEPSRRKYHTYTEFGKLVWGDMSFFDDKEANFFLHYDDVPFIPSLCYAIKDLSIQNLSGAVNITQNEGSIIDTNIEEKTVSIDLKEAIQFEFTGIKTINKIAPVGGNMIMDGDACTEVTGVNGLIVINDVCLPPCYQCDERLTEGDVKLSIDNFESDLETLETSLGI